jgi:hypothetical protein
MSLLDDTGGSRTPCGTRRTRPPRAPAGRTGFSGAEQGTRSASPVSSERRWCRRSRREPAVNNTGPDATHRVLPPHRRAPSRARGPSRGSQSNDASIKRSVFRPRDAPNLQAYNPLFKERAPELHVAYRARRGVSPVGPTSVAFHGASLASNRRTSRGEAAFSSDSAHEPTFLWLSIRIASRRTA